MMVFFFFFFKQKTAYEMRISDWSSDVCSSDLSELDGVDQQVQQRLLQLALVGAQRGQPVVVQQLDPEARFLGALAHHAEHRAGDLGDIEDRKSTRLNSSH